jgi:F-type H+-transporting ATPase subunit b
MRGAWLIVSVLVALLVLSCGRGLAEKPGEARADDEPQKAADTGHKTDGESHGGGAKDPFARALDLTIWTIVVFVILLVLLRLLAWKPMLQALQAREKAIADAIEQAKQDREEAARLREQFQQELNRAAEQVRAMLDEGRRDVQHQSDEMLAAARAEIQAEKERLRREIETARDQALQDIWNRSAELASAISTKAIRRTLSVDDHRRLVDEALAELGQAVDNMSARRGGPSA